MRIQKNNIFTREFEKWQLPPAVQEHDTSFLYISKFIIFFIKKIKNKNNLPHEQYKAQECLKNYN